MRLMHPLLLLPLLSACTQTLEPAPTPLCAIRRYTVDVALPGPGVPRADRYEDVLDTALAARPGRDHLLFMSGGGQFGAFGAGYLEGWQQKSGRLPDFAVVTGISTGALLATPAFTNRANVAAAGYSIRHERELLNVYGTSPISIARRGSIGSLDPLGRKLDILLDDAMLEAVAAGHREGRRLLVGAVDIDLGAAVAFDLTEVAGRWSSAAGSERTRLKGCYIKALLASAAVPAAFQPIMIDNRLYVDGNARFGVFNENLGDYLDDRVQSRPASIRATPAKTSIIINGSLETRPRCGRADVPDDPAAQEACARSASLEGRHRGWNLADLVGRSISILLNQVSRFSAAYAKAGAGEIHLVRISDDARTHKLSLDGETRSCEDWRRADASSDRPIEFHPREMRCLIDYGRARALADPGAVAG